MIKEFVMKLQFHVSDTSKTDKTGIVKDRIVTRFGNHLTNGNINIMIEQSNNASNSYGKGEDYHMRKYFSEALKMTKIKNSSYYNSVCV